MSDHVDQLPPRKKVGYSDPEIVHRALKMVAGTCDRAYRRDGTGFDKLDTVRGAAFAEAETIPTANLYEAAQLANKYGRQLPVYMADEVKRIAAKVRPPPTAKFDLDLVVWSEPRLIQTKNGLKQIREWDIEGPPGADDAEARAVVNSFWTEWKAGSLRKLGYSVYRDKGRWKLTEWREPTSEQTETNRRRAAAIEQAEEQTTQNANWEPELPLIFQARFEEVEAIYAKIQAETGEDYSYQLPGIKRLVMAVYSGGSALDASDTGVGKTPIACGVAKTLGMKLFVVCPKSIRTPWLRMARRFGLECNAINYEMLRTGNTGAGWWTQVGRRRLFQWNGEHLDPEIWMVVFDECHRMKDYTTLNQAMGVGALAQGYKAMALSATAADNPLQMKFVALCTGLIQRPEHFWAWATAHGVKRSRFGYEFIGGQDVLTRIHRKIFPARGNRIRIADLKGRFPETRIIAEAYEMNGATEEIQKVYDEMHAEIAKLEATESRDKGANILTAMLRARQRTELLKVPTLCQMALDGVEEGMSAIVICNFEDSLQAIAARLRTTNIIHGGQDPENREELIDLFNRDEIDRLVLNIKAGGVGISLHGWRGARTRLSLINPTFSGIDLLQALGRPWRAGGAYSIQKVIFAANTIEEDACEAVRSRVSRIRALNDGDAAGLDQALKF